MDSTTFGPASVWRGVLGLSCFFALLSSASRAAALEIELSFSSQFAARQAAVAAMRRAADIWESWLSDPVTVAMEVSEFSDPERIGVLAGALPTYDFIDYGYEEVRNALIADATTADDHTAVAHLPAGPNVALRFWDLDQEPVTLEGDDWINQYLSLTRATAKALGLPHGSQGPDAGIDFNADLLDDGF
ncbi:MAG: NF038122 family metalloprotease, partial [Planctomycetota bacterium]